MGGFMKRNEQIQSFDCIVGRNLRTKRLLSGYSQKYIGQQIGLSFQQIQKYEKAINRISAGRLWVLSQVLKVPIESFFDGCGLGPKDIEVVQPTSDEMLLLRALRQLPTHQQKSFVNVIITMASDNK